MRAERGTMWNGGRRIGGRLNAGMGRGGADESARVDESVRKAEDPRDSPPLGTVDSDRPRSPHRETHPPRRGGEKPPEKKLF